MGPVERFLYASIRKAMSISEAMEVLGIPANAGYDISKSDVMSAWKRKILQAHPDRGGSPELAVKLNVARDLLLGKGAYDPDMRRPSRPDPEPAVQDYSGLKAELEEFSSWLQQKFDALMDQVGEPFPSYLTKFDRYLTRRWIPIVTLTADKLERWDDEKAMELFDDLEDATKAMKRGWDDARGVSVVLNLQVAVDRVKEWLDWLKLMAKVGLIASKATTLLNVDRPGVKSISDNDIDAYSDEYRNLLEYANEAQKWKASTQHTIDSLEREIESRLKQVASAFAITKTAMPTALTVSPAGLDLVRERLG